MLGMMGDRLRKWLRGIPRSAVGDAAADTTAMREPSGMATSSDSGADGHDHKGSKYAEVTDTDSMAQIAEQAGWTETLKKAPELIETRGDSQNAE